MITSGIIDFMTKEIVRYVMVGFCMGCSGSVSDFFFFVVNNFSFLGLY